jgi:hypothetical protein
MPSGKIAAPPAAFHQSSVNRFTAREPDFRFNGARWDSGGGVMTGKIDIWIASVAFGVASYAAMILNCLAREELHLSDAQICKLAISGALLIATALAASFLRWGIGKAR